MQVLWQISVVVSFKHYTFTRKILNLGSGNIAASPWVNPVQWQQGATDMAGMTYPIQNIQYAYQQPAPPMYGNMPMGFVAPAQGYPAPPSDWSQPAPPSQINEQPAPPQN